ncbi:MAG: tetratricopeptide repeat protein [Eubacterium sp.]|nr:tetratricopeptide repeat protein [Eubacterium sp.]
MSNKIRIVKGNIQNWKMIFIVTLSVVSIIVSIISLVGYMNYAVEVKQIRKELNSFIDSVEDPKTITDEYIEFCESVSNRTDSAINEIITIVGIFASIITLLGVLITFNAPKDIEKDIDEIRNILEETKNLADEQKYNLEVSDASREKTIYHRIKALSKVINDYPNKWQAYLYRGCEYDDKEEYNNAINEYKSAKKRGCDDETYYNNMSISLSKRAKATNNRTDFVQAIDYISKAIEIDPEDSIYYSNRGGIYSDIGKNEKALEDYDRAISFDPQNYEAYTNKAILYIELKDNTDNSDLYISYRNKAIDCIKQAIRLNSEDNYNLKRLDKLLKDDLSNKSKDDDSHELFADLIFDINEKMGDIDVSEDNFIDAISNYTNALIKFNIPVESVILSNLSIIERICDKIYKCERNMPSVDISESINRKLQIFIIMLLKIAYSKYTEGEVEKAGLLYEYSTILSGFGSSSSNNLAYMIRRGEYVSERFSISELLSCKTPEETSAFLRINRALCILKGQGFERNVEDALREINTCENDLDSAISWWSDEDLVGKSESNIVLLLLCLLEKIDIDESVNINQMISQANEDGYNLPDNIMKIADEVLNS